MSNPSLRLSNCQIYGRADTSLTVRDSLLKFRDDLPVDELIDCGGRFLTPAFVDGHIHATGTGFSILGLDLSSARDQGHAISMIAQFCHGQPHDEVLTGFGWDESVWPQNAAPSKADLDRACGGRQFYASRVDAHSGLVSSALWDRVAGVADAIGAPPDADSAHARLSAFNLVHQYATAAVSDGQRRRMQTAALHRARQSGIAMVVEMAGPTISSERDLRALLTLAQEPGMPLVQAYWGELGAIDLVTELGLAGAGGDLFCDGAIGSHTAALAQPYADSRPDEPEHGHLWLTREQVAQHVQLCTRAGIQAGFHAIGDRAVRAVIDGIADVASELGERAVRRLQHRIEHCEMVDATGITTMARLGIIASVQPMFDRAWGGRTALYQQRLGERSTTLNPIADLLAAGVHVAFSSDAPVTPLAPWSSVHAATHHHTAQQRISPQAAFSAMTVAGWRAIGGQLEAGELREGAPAHLALWDCERLNAQSQPYGLPDGVVADSAECRTPLCMLTVVAGQVAYRAPGLP